MRNYKNLVFIKNYRFSALSHIHKRKNPSEGTLNSRFHPCAYSHQITVAIAVTRNTHSNVCVCVCVSALHYLHTWICQMISLHLKSCCTHGILFDWINIPGCFAADSQCYYLSHKMHVGFNGIVLNISHHTFAWRFAAELKRKSNSCKCYQWCDVLLTISKLYICILCVCSHV